MLQPGRGGNTTGFMLFEYSLSVKWLELLRQIAPSTTRVAVLRNPANPAGIAEFVAIRSAAQPLGVEVSPINVQDAGEIERAVAGLWPVCEWRLDLDVKRVGVGLSRSDHRARGPVQATCGLGQSVQRHRRRLDLLRAGSGRPIPARGRLRRSHP